jgi:hypothetical protein
MAELKRILQENDDLREVMRAIVAIQPDARRTAADCFFVVHALAQYALEPTPEPQR